MAPRNTSIQRKLMNVIQVTTVVTLVLMCTAYTIFEYITYRNHIKSQVATLASVIASNTSAAVAFDSHADAIDILDALRAEKHVVSAAVYNAQGKLFAKYPENIPDTELPAKPGAIGYTFESSFLVGFTPVIQENNRLGTFYIKSDLEAMYAQLRRYALLAIVLLLVSLAIAYLISTKLQRTITAPILALQRASKRVSDEGDYSIRATKVDDDEIGSLTDSFNNMLGQIESQDAEIRSFNQHLEEKIQKRTAQLEEANVSLQKQKDFVETIINSSVDVVAVFDLDLKYVMLNKRADSYYHLKRDRIVGRHILDVFPAVKNSGMYEGLKKALNGEAVHDPRYFSPIVKKYFENFYIPLKDENDAVYGVLTVGHDISGLIETTQKLETINAALKKSNRDLEQFAYIASHDLQEPLRKIQTFSQLMGQNFNNKEQLLKYHEKISQSANRMQQLIQDVLNFSRISNSEDAFVDVNLNQVLYNLKTDFELMMMEKEAKITHGDLPTMQGVPLQLSQLFSNLISNSLKYSNKKPVIDISVEPVDKNELKTYPILNTSTPYFKIIFKDNGIGFEPQYSEQIFTIFQRLHNKQAYSGTGIGLALCRKIVENHKGYIYAKSAPDEGATFYIILPFRQN